MSNQIIRKYGLGNTIDLTVPTVAINPMYKLGDIMDVVNDNQSIVTRYMYVKDGGSGMTKYGCYVLSYSGTAGAEVFTGACASLAVYQIVCFPQCTFTASYFGWVAIEGAITCLPTSSTGTANYFGEAANGVNTVSTNSATLTTASAVVFVATATGTSTTAIALGNRVIIA